MGAGSWVTPENFVPFDGGGSGAQRPADAYHGLINGDVYWNDLGQYWQGFNPATPPSFPAGTTDGEEGTGELTGLVWSDTVNGWVNPTYYVAA